MIKDQFPVINIGQLDEFKQEDILISRFAPYLAVHKNLQQAHKHDFYHLVFFTDGAGSQTIDFERFEVKPFQFYFMIPGQVHHWAFEGHVDGYVVNFSASFFQSFLLKADYFEQFSFFSGNANEAVIEVPVAMQADMINLFEKLLRESEDKQRGALDMVRLLLVELFISIGRLSAPNEQKQVSPYNLTLLKSFRNLIETNFRSLKLPKEYAELLYITPNHLNALCNDLLDISAGEVIRNRVVLEAKRLLVNPELGITEIAGQLNFSDNSYFTKFFKKQTGSTPEEFRKQFITKRS
ncbi:helix-turn-helix domain-containing protein [Mucilaginibacter sp. X5P1]|uniref:helix-turn-helix domain-containing protein n=1 Tax=Mucilaginibacter sp. X5P1 TaxID=2723088 RepID=UPI00185965FD|nr:helix-turn-helix transcriptional regulator [Mucilaginibacter sp. X5P1]MBB6137033.1 AraC-like DNA-binding protein [Mucilaginibacter sp. X5P1]